MADGLPVLDRAAGAVLHRHHDRYELCAYCPKMCRFSCPVAEADARETLTPWGKMSAPFLVLAGEEANDPRVSLETAFETSWGCTGCGHCIDYCNHRNDVPTALAALREAGVTAGLHSPVSDEIAVAFREHGNPIGRDLSAAIREVTPAALRDDGTSPVLFLPGCSTIAQEPASVRAAVKVLERLEAEGVALDGHGRCCGLPLWWAGHADRFDEHAREFARTVRRRRTLVVSDAACAWALRVLYPERGHKLVPEVLHVSEWIASFFRERVVRSKTKLGGTYWYHDPCTLARPLGVTEEPRAVLSAILAEGVREFGWHGKDAVCCGAGGLLPMSMPETAKRMAEARVAEPKAEGGAIVTSCPSCLHRLKSTGVEAHDLLTLVAKAI
jgi:Fe-S oxidoreductase